MKTKTIFIVLIGFLTLTILVLQACKKEGSKPLADFSANVTSGLAPLRVTFTDSSTNNPTNWIWNFGDGNTSNEQNPTNTYTNAGTYTVSLTVVNNFGTSTSIKTNYISAESGGGSFTDPRDGQTYKTVQLGRQIWMAENLRATKFNDGSDISLITNSSTWANCWKDKTPAFCWYNNDGLDYSKSYGALYNQYAVNTGKLCPVGWHIPSDTEWNELINYVGGKDVAAIKLKESGTTHWDSPNNATNESGFTALPGGRRSSGFRDMGYGGFWYSSTIFNHISYILWIQPNDILWYDLEPVDGASVRCIKNEQKK